MKASELANQAEWTLDQALIIVRQLEEIAITCNLHIALGGSIIIRGFSEKDIDVFVYPARTMQQYYYETFKVSCIVAGILVWELRKHEGDNKTVYRTEWNGKRIDFFFVK